MIDSQINLLVNQQNTYAFIVEDIEAAMANVDLKGSQAQRASYGLQKTADAFMLGATTHTKAGNTVIDATCDSATILSVMSRTSTLLSENDVPDNGKYVVIAPWVKEKLQLAGVKWGVNEGMDGSKGGVSFAKYLDLDVYVSNNVVQAAASTGAATYCLAGSYRALGFAQGLLKSRAIESKDLFGYHMSGLMVYGKEVIFPKELVSMVLTYAAETAI